MVVVSFLFVSEALAFQLVTLEFGFKENVFLSTRALFLVYETILHNS